MGEGALLGAAARLMNASRSGRAGSLLAFGPDLVELDWSAPGAGRGGAYLVDVPARPIDLAQARRILAEAVASEPTVSTSAVRADAGGDYL